MEDLFGQPADYDELASICERSGVELIGDAAQSFGATWGGRRVGSLCRLTTTSFFPASLCPGLEKRDLGVNHVVVFVDELAPPRK